MTDCKWERFKATRAPMLSQQQQIQLCRCKLCELARLFPNLHKRSQTPGVKARHDVLAWKPEPPKETGDDGAA